MEKLQNIWERIRRQSAAGVSRFRSAAVLAVLFFLLVMGRVMAVSSEKVSLEELFPESILYIMTALVTTLLFAVLWRIGLERKDKVKNVYELVNIPVLAGSYFLWQMPPSKNVKRPMPEAFQNEPNMWGKRPFVSLVHKTYTERQGRQSWRFYSFYLLWAVSWPYHQKKCL